MPLDLKRDFSRFLAGHEGRLHFAAHSHHFWPDVSYDAHMRYWTDSSCAADGKWNKVAETRRNAQENIARILNLPAPETICFASNTHEFVMRLLSCLPAERKPARILTTNSEFYSFRRQLDRLEEDGLVQSVRIDTEPYADFGERFAAAVMKENADLIYLSQVFFDSGLCVSNLPEITAACKRRDTFIVIDGYHGFMAVPTDLSAVADRIFYIAGGYKYAMAGEGCCFMHCPPGYGARPRDTGWFADFAHLDEAQGGTVHYPSDGMRFMGATPDPCGLYRLNAVLEWLFSKGITVDGIHQHSIVLQEAFLEQVDNPIFVPLVSKGARGNFLAFRLKGAETMQKQLLDRGVVTDSRGDRLRFGFGIYHDLADVENLLGRLSGLDSQTGRKFHVR